MIRIDGTDLNGLPVVGLERVRDLEYFDGPLLSHFRHRRQGDNYLYYWCDCDAAVNRWMLLRVSETNIIRLVNRFVPLDFVIPRACQDDFVYFLDLNGAGTPARVTLSKLESVPQEYTPVRGAYLGASALDATDPKSYSVLIEQTLSIQDLSNLPRIFSQVYAVFYNLLILRPRTLEGHPWRGGFSAMHFYRSMLESIPGEDRPIVQALQYASPGFIRFFSLEPTVAVQVGRLISRVVHENHDIRRSYENLGHYIHQNRLNEITSMDDTAFYDVELSSLAMALLTSLGIPEPEELIAAAPRPFEAAKIARSLMRRVRQLALMESDGLVKFPIMRS